MSMTTDMTAAVSALDVAILADSLLREKAIAAVEEYLREHGGNAAEIRASQLHGLRVIAQYQPEQIRNFASKQREKAEARRETAGDRAAAGLDAVIDFWRRVENLLSPAARHTWSLVRACEEALPDALRLAELPSGARLTPQEQNQRRAIKQQADQWKKDWLAQSTLIFFQHFCIEFLYRTRNLRAVQERHD